MTHRSMITFRFNGLSRPLVGSIGIYRYVLDRGHITIVIEREGGNWAKGCTQCTGGAGKGNKCGGDWKRNGVVRKRASANAA